ncbi:MAG TPA: glycosyltransferase family 4 protein [Anaerolineae bacterium]|nr:glycosyltransferase family 4 protein [Anaerolineae bacterium]
MRIVIAGDYPEAPPSVVGGIQAVISNTLTHLGACSDLDLHVVSCEKWRSRPLERRVTGQGPWTTHYLPSSPRIPHTVSLFTVDRRAVRQQIEALAPDLIHAHGQAAAYPFAAFDTGRPTLVTVHGINTLEARLDPRGGAVKGRLRVAVWGYAERLCLRRASDIVVISPFVQNVIAPHTRARFHVIENPVHDDFFHLDPEPEHGKVLMVGSIQKGKGTLEAIQAMALVHQQVPHARLYLAGGVIPAYRHYGDVVRRYVAEQGAEKYVTFLGRLEHAPLLEAYRTSHVFFFPSYLESSPVALAEAMAAGLPSVVSDIGGTAHMVQEGVTGYRVRAGDVEQMAARIVQLLHAEATCRRLGAQARVWATAHSSAAMVARQLCDLYHELAGVSR